MSHDIELVDKDTGEVLTMPEVFTDGGTYCVGGTDECHLNVTYNYGRCYAEVFPDEGLSNGRISWLYGRTAVATIETLKRGVAMLGTERDADYWKATEGNAGAALARLLTFAEQHPDGVWQGD